MKFSRQIGSWRHEDSALVARRRINGRLERFGVFSLSVPLGSKVADVNHVVDASWGLSKERRTRHKGRAAHHGGFSGTAPSRVRVQVRPTEDGIVLFFRDITEQKKATAALLLTEKLTAVGRLAASIAHEINNPLESVTNLLFLARRSDNVAEVQDYLDTAERELRRVSNITNQTLRSYKQSTNAREVQAEELIESALSLFQGKIVNSKIVVDRKRSTQKAIECFDDEIRQVLNNLVGNAIDAMSFGGHLSLRSREVTDWKMNRRGLQLTVADTGVGISPRHLLNIRRLLLHQRRWWGRSRVVGKPRDYQTASWQAARPQQPKGRQERRSLPTVSTV